MADQDHAAQAQKNRAALGVARKIGFNLAHLLFDEQRGNLRAERRHKDTLELLQQKLGSALGGLERNIARHTIGNDDIEVA